MKSALTIIKLAASHVPASVQDDWTNISKNAIKNNIVEPLSDKGLIQVVDCLAYDMCMDTFCHLEGHSTEEEFEKLVIEKSSIADNIIDVAALAADIHPDIIHNMITVRADYYTELFVSHNSLTHL